MELVEALQRADENQPNAKLNQYSMRNVELGKYGGDGSLRTYFYHYKTLRKNGIIKG